MLGGCGATTAKRNQHRKRSFRLPLSNLGKTLAAHARRGHAPDTFSWSATGTAAPYRKTRARLRSPSHLAPTGWASSPLECHIRQPSPPEPACHSRRLPPGTHRPLRLACPSQPALCQPAGRRLSFPLEENHPLCLFHLPTRLFTAPSVSAQRSAETCEAPHLSPADTHHGKELGTLITSPKASVGRQKAPSN